jgi:segregation and condensation protein A
MATQLITLHSSLITCLVIRPPMSFRIQLDVFRGPLDLLLYLVRKHEVDVVDLPIAPITQQFLAHLSVLEQLDVNGVGDFLEMASTLVEIKSRMVLPQGDEVQEELDDPRHELVRRLLEYKTYKDAASVLEERGRSWQERFPRLDRGVRERPTSAAEGPIAEIEIWDLVSAFGRIIQAHEQSQPTTIVYDETPIVVYMRRIVDRLQTRGQVAMSELFEPGQHKSVLIGIFLALLELVRHHHVRAEQNALHGEIWVLPTPATNASLDFTEVDEYTGAPPITPARSASEGE